MFGVIFEASQWNNSRWLRFGLGRDDRDYPAALQRGIDFPIRISSISCHRCGVMASQSLDVSHVLLDQVSFIHVAGCNHYIDDD